ncbi:hypothetical protein C8Q75DRAFT_557155 [Abortiporus biennis]|nr:hypothetical protein C8Q75DRAFT_557155 [Abortiporus biennis]
MNKLGNMSPKSYVVNTERICSAYLLLAQPHVSFTGIARVLLLRHLYPFWMIHVSPALQEDEEALQDFKNKILPTLPQSHKAIFEEAFVNTDEHGWPLSTVVLERLHPAPDSTSAPPRESSSQRSDSFHQPALHESSSTSNPDDNKIRLLIRHPIISPCSIFGRATKGFVALDLGEKKLKFLKDSWRYHGGDYHPEIEVYEKLQQAAGVKNIAKVEGGGDILDKNGRPQTTVTHPYLKVESEDHAEYLPQ